MRKRYIIFDTKYSTYYSRGTQINRDGSVGPRWEGNTENAIFFFNIQEAKLALRRLKNNHHQDNRAAIYMEY